MPPLPASPSNAICRDGFAAFYRTLHERFTPRQQELAEKRKRVLAASHEGTLPNYHAPSPATTEPWRIELPAWVADQRNQMTGPADEAELVVKMLNSGAPGVMLDLEDSMANAWDHSMLGIANVKAALYGELTYEDKKRGRTVGIDDIKHRDVDARARTASEPERDLRGAPTSASLFDLALLTFDLDLARLKHPLCVYIPKSESAEEALWWRDVFAALAEFKGRPHDYIKCMALCEAHPIRIPARRVRIQFARPSARAQSRALGLHGEPDPLQSERSGWVLPDRNTIPHDVAVLSKSAHADSLDLPQARHARDRRHDGALPFARRRRTQRTRAFGLGAGQEK